MALLHNSQENASVTQMLHTNKHYVTIFSCTLWKVETFHFIFCDQAVFDDWMESGNLAHRFLAVNKSTEMAHLLIKADNSVDDIINSRKKAV